VASLFCDCGARVSISDFSATLFWRFLASSIALRSIELGFPDLSFSIGDPDIFGERHFHKGCRFRVS